MSTDQFGVEKRLVSRLAGGIVSGPGRVCRCGVVGGGGGGGANQCYMVYYATNYHYSGTMLLGWRRWAGLGRLAGC